MRISNLLPITIAACAAACARTPQPLAPALAVTAPDPGTATSPSSPTMCCPIVELRQYTLRPGQRDVLIDLFEREFIEAQEAEGITVLGQFRDLDRPDRFVWLRGFTSMPARARALGAFYGGPLWKAHREEANATMLDSDNVLLLRPARPASGFSLDGLRRSAPGSNPRSAQLVIATLYFFDRPPTVDFIDFFEREVAPLLTAAGAAVVARFVTEASVNTFPALPVREGEHVFVFVSAFEDARAYERHLAELAGSPQWRDGAAKALSHRLIRPPETLRLAPTARSLLGYPKRSLAQSIPPSGEVCPQNRTPVS